MAKVFESTSLTIEEILSRQTRTLRDTAAAYSYDLILLFTGNGILDYPVVQKFFGQWFTIY